MSNEVVGIIIGVVVTLLALVSTWLIALATPE
jgi:tetrahydromethanopterin S-methyltransferase subunit F